MDERAIARWRMHTLRLAGQTYPTPTAVVGGLLAVQAENHAQASWAVATRTPGTTKAAFDRLFDEGAVLRTHLLRPTWHFVLPDDIGWLVELTAPRVRRSFVQLQRALEVSDAELERSAVVIVDALAGGVHLTRDALGARLQEAGLPAAGQRLGLLVDDAELSGLVCSGAMAGLHHTYALLPERAPQARRLDRDEARAELVLRYFTGHGPATERDLAYWATMTVTDVRAGLADVADRLDSFDYGGRTYWFGEPTPEPAPGPPSEVGTLHPRGHLLQILDEYHNGYQDSRGVLDADGIVPRGRPATVGMALVDGQMVGGMRRTVRSSTVEFAVSCFRDLDGGERAALDEAAGRYGEFLDLPARVAWA